jgi:tripartite-type tricarboxylate transporter receptor subunit TctC
MRTGILAAVAAMTMTICAAAQAQDSVESFYKGRQLKLDIGSAPGGAFDGYGRLVGQYIGKYLPGNPTVLPNNMPGAGDHRLNGYLYSVAPKDGSEFAITFPGALLDPLVGTK